jgi:glycosyltransferase involved in cell wall biosynthesis
MLNINIKARDENMAIVLRDSYEVPNNVINTVPEPLVSIVTITFQHALYIKDCIEGVIMQKITFPIEFIIGEDYSKDGTREIVLEYAKNYPDLIRVITADYNMHHLKGNSKRSLGATRGKYIALCEGDDYWTDPLKLQKQVEFLEGNEEYGIVSSDYDVFFQNEKRLEKGFLSNNFNANIEYDLFLYNYINKRYFIRTATVLFRTEFIKTYPLEVSEKIRVGRTLGDNQFWSYILFKSKGKYFPYSSAVYRVSNNTASRPGTLAKDRKHKLDVLNLALDVAKEFDLPKKHIRECEIRVKLLEMEFHVQDGLKYKTFIDFIYLTFFYRKFSKSTVKLFLKAICGSFYEKKFKAA